MPPKPARQIFVPKKTKKCLRLRLARDTVRAIVEACPGQSRTLTIPADGAGANRFSRNDTAMKDPAGGIRLIVEQGPEQGREITIPAEGARVGRSSRNDIVIHDPAISRFHCRFFFKPGEGLWAQDLASINQTLLNNKPLAASRVHTGDRLTMGQTTLKVVNNESAVRTVRRKGSPSRASRIAAAQPE